MLFLLASLLALNVSLDCQSWPEYWRILTQKQVKIVPIISPIRTVFVTSLVLQAQRLANHLWRIMLSTKFRCDSISIRNCRAKSSLIQTLSVEQSDSSRAFTTCFRVATYFLTDDKNISSGAEITWKSADTRILCFAVCSYRHEITLTNSFSSSIQI